MSSLLPSRGPQTRGPRGRAHPSTSASVTASTPTPPQHSARDADVPDSETDETKALRAKYLTQLATAHELFPDWTDDDILFTLNDAHGDLQVAIGRITEGQAHQWGAVKAKKAKKEASTVPPSTSSFPSRGGYGGDRGGRGRGSFDTGRGGRGGRGGAGRGARGSVTTSGGLVSRSNGGTPSFNGTIQTSSPMSAAHPVSTPAWGPGPASTSASTESRTPAAWADVAVDSKLGDWAKTSSEVPDTSSWGGEHAAHAAHEEPVSTGWGATPTEDPPVPMQPSAPAPAKKSVPGSTKMSWAQIARPPSPPKPTPPPPAPVALTPPVVLAPEPYLPHPTTTASPPPIEEPSAPAPSVHLPNAITPSTWGAAPSPGPLDAWASAVSSAPVPLGMGEGWADAVTATHPLHETVVPADVKAHLPPHEINAAGPIVVSTPVADVPATSVLSALVTIEQSAAFAPVPAVSHEQKHQQLQQSTSTAAPPGLPAKRSGGRPLQQEAAVVMPLAVVERVGSAGLESIGVQFGSLNLFDAPNSGLQQQQQPQFGQQPQELPKQEQSHQQPSYSQEQQPLVQQYSQDAQQKFQEQQQQQQQHQPQQAEQPHHRQHHQQQHQNHNEQGVQTSFTQTTPPSNPFPHQPAPSAFSNRYPSNASPYGTVPNHHHQHQHQQQQQHQSEEHQQPQQQHTLVSNAGASPYAPFKPDVISPYFQQHAHTPAAQAAQQTAPSSAYGAFGALPQAQSQATFAASQSDYSALYGAQEARNFYDAYGQPGNGFPAASTVPRQDDSSSSVSQAPLSGTPQPQQGQHQQIPGQQQGYSGMMPYPYGYGYYQGYPQSSYPPQNYLAYQQAGYGGYNQTQQFRGYGGQPQQQHQQQQHQQSQQSQQSQFGRPGQQATTPFTQPYGAAVSGYGAASQVDGRKDYSAKDLDRGFFGTS